jgi:hypothetical protein
MASMSSGVAEADGVLSAIPSCPPDVVCVGTGAGVALAAQAAAPNPKLATPASFIKSRRDFVFVSIPILL